VLAALVLAALVVVAANAIRTIRIEGAPERALQRVFGATEADLRRPYLYLGALYGFIAGVIATLAAAGVLLLVQPALAAIAQLLDQPAGPGAAGWMPLLAMAPVATLLGWVGAWFGCLFEPDLEASE
jgi:cell division transport system permease protein